MRIILGVAISLQVLMLAQTPVQAQQAAKQQQASLPAQAAKPEPMPRLIPGTVGHGTLTLTSSAAVTYQEYFAHACPLVLTVDAFGWSTHAALNTSGPCPDNVAKITPETMMGALNKCAAYSTVPPCSVVAVGREVVWDGPISFVPGRFVPRGDDQVPVVLRRIATDDMEAATSETDVGVIRFHADGRSGTLTFQRHAELGECSGSLAAPDGDKPAAVALTCTKIGEVAGTITFKPGEHAGSGTASAGKRQFVLSVLPETDAMKNGTALYTPPPKPRPAINMQAAKQADKSADKSADKPANKAADKPKATKQEGKKS